MMRKIYTCEICRDQKPPMELYGIHFTSTKDFDIRHAASTDGVHICEHCIHQLRELPLPDAGCTVVKRYKQV